MQKGCLMGHVYAARRLLWDSSGTWTKMACTEYGRPSIGELPARWVGQSQGQSGSAQVGVVCGMLRMLPSHTDNTLQKRRPVGFPVVPPTRSFEGMMLSSLDWP
eukprot:2615454-Amphidinium_carterae.1